MGDDLILDSKWFVEQIIAMNKKLAKLEALPGIEQHLARQNSSITLALNNCRALDLRVSTVERNASSRSANWRRLLDLSLRVSEGLILAYLLANVLGVT